MLVDLDYFFAQCEELRNPTFKVKPLVIGVYSGRSENSGAVSTSNYLARKYGVKSGMSLSQAKKKLKEVDSIFIPQDKEYYSIVSERIMNILRRYANFFEQYGIDEAYLDVSQKTKGSFKLAKELAEKIKIEVRNLERITCSIGIGQNKLIAKIASNIQKPDGLTIIEPKEIKEFLDPLPIKHLIGIGRKTEKKMQTLGIKLIGELASYDVQILIDVFGKNLGVYFHNAAKGIDNTPIKEKELMASISRISTLKEDTRNLDFILQTTTNLCEEIYDKVNKKKLKFRQIGIIAVMDNMKIKSKTKTFDTPVNDLKVFKETVKELFEKLINQTNLKIRRVGVKTAIFNKERNEQRKLTSFSNP
jgi:DNA polymerase IV (DinB-like DNA polymerase)